MDASTRETHASLMQNLRRQISRFGAPMSPPMFEFLSSMKKPAAKMAAVLVALFLKDGDLHVVLTRRSPHLRFQPGDVSFPGGSVEKQDADEVATCLRESLEEINMQPSLVTIIGKMYPIVVRSESYVAPVIGVIPNHVNFTPNEEVDVVFTLPLRRFLSSRGHRKEDWSYGDKTYELDFFEDEVEGQTITTWGLTAHTCIRLAVAVFQRQPDFKCSYHHTDPFKENRLKYEQERTRMRAPSKL